MVIKGIYWSSPTAVSTSATPIPLLTDAYGRLVVTNVAGSNLMVVGGTYHTSAPTLANNGTNTLELDVNGNLKVVEQYAPVAEDNSNGVIAMVARKLSVSTYVASRFVDYGSNATANVKSTPGNVFSLSCYNGNAAARYVQLHNTATTPGGAAVPLFSFLVPTASQVVIGEDFFTASGMNFSTGIAFAFSTTQGTYTAGAAGDQFTQVVYK